MSQGLVKEKLLYGFNAEHLVWDGLYETKEELQKAELQEEENGRINWDKFDSIVNKTKEIIKEELILHKKRRKAMVFVFDLQGNLIHTFPSTDHCAAFYGISREQVNVYISKCIPYKKQSVIFKKEKNL